MSDRRAPPAERHGRILIVDDEPFNVDYLEQELESLGLDTETAADGVAALELVAAHPPDLVLLDVMMPRMDGISTLRALKGDPETRLIPVVLMTALNAVEDRVRGIEAGADDFLSKPVDERELLARIRTALDLKRAIDERLGELRSTSAHLERYGRQAREVAILAMRWGLRGTSVPDEAVAFVGRRARQAGAARIRELGGQLAEGDDGPLIAVFDGRDTTGRATAAIEAAQAVLDSDAADDAADALIVCAAVSVGHADVGSARVQRGGELHWAYTASGPPVVQASRLAQAVPGGLLIDRHTAAAVIDRFALKPDGDGAYRVREPAGDPAAPSTPRERHIRTILITDIVDSTKTAERIGDRAWTRLLGAHDRATREELIPFRGEELDTTGDGFVLAFASPERAIRCAFALIKRVSALGLTMRAGVHTAEVEDVEGTPRGIALSIATRIADRASPGEIWVSDTARELTAGSGLAFADRGEHVLKGVSAQKRLYAASDEALVPTGRTDPAEYPEGLTAREVDVLRLVAAGLTDADAANRLFISVRTVNAHLRSIYRKLGVPSRAAAGRFAVEHGLL